MLFRAAGSGIGISVTPSVFLFLILSLSVFQPFSLSPSLNLVNSFSSYQDGIRQKRALFGS